MAVFHRRFSNANRAGAFSKGANRFIGGRPYVLHAAPANPKMPAASDATHRSMLFLRQAQKWNRMRKAGRQAGREDRGRRSEAGRMPAPKARIGRPPSPRLRRAEGRVGRAEASFERGHRSICMGMASVR